MNLKEFHEDFLLEIQSSAVALGNFEKVQFTEIALKKLAEAEEVIDLTPSQFEGVGKNRKKIQIDAYGFDSVDDSIVCVVSDYSSNQSVETITKTEIDSIFGALEGFLEVVTDDSMVVQLEHSSEAAQAALEIRARQASAARFKVFLVTNRKLSDRLKALPSRNIGLTRAEFAVWDLERFYNSAMSSRGREDIEIDLKEWLPNGLAALRDSSGSADVSTYLAVIPGSVLAAIYDKYGSRLLEGNVRSFLSLRGSVNKGIRTTILTEPDKFLAFNNGLSTTATDIEFTSREGGVFITKINGLQIVNGGQTTASLFTYMRQEKQKLENLDKVFVQMKLIVVSQDLTAELVPNIARYANTQNRISEADFFSNSPFHIRMEEISKRISSGPKVGEVAPSRWFYERARGAYGNEKARLVSVSEVSKFEKLYPRNQVVTKTDLAKYSNCWNGKPHMVSKGAQKNFIDFANEVADKFSSESGKDYFGDDFYKRVVAQAIIFDSTHRAVKKADWYEPGYLANIVAYAIARVSSELTDRKLQINWAGIWKSMAISAHFEKTLVSAAREMREVLNDPTRPQKNVSEWAKTENCWKQAKARRILISPEFEAELQAVTSEMKREARSNEKASGQALNEVEKLTKLLAVDPKVWDDLLASPRLSVSPIEAGVVKVLKKDGYLSEKQADKLFELVQRAEAEGIKVF